MKQFVFPALVTKCQAFSDDVAKQEHGELDAKNLFRWQSLLYNAGYRDLAFEFTQLNPNCSESDIRELEKFVAESEGKEVKPTRCCTFECPLEQIESCHKKVLTNANGEPSNSPAYHIREEALKQYHLLVVFNELKEDVFEKIIAGDKSAQMEDNFVKSAAILKTDNPQAFEALLADLKEMGVSTRAFSEEVNKHSKGRGKAKQAAEVARIDLPDHLKPYGEGADPSVSYIDENGHIIIMVKEKEGFSPTQGSNFVARFTEVREFDDGVDITPQFVIEGLQNGEKELPVITVDSKDFQSMKWPERNWGNVLITSAPKARDVIRETIQRVSSNAPVIRVYYSLGWKNIDDAWSYLYSGGAIGGEGVSVAEISELRGYFFKENDYTALECAEYVQKFLDIGNNDSVHETTIPLLAHAFLSILIEKLKMEEIEPRYLMWLYGVSGSFKTALTIVLLNFFGSFNSPPATFNDTAAAQEKKAFLTKDSLLLVDDFHPSASPAEAKTKATLANALTRKYGDRITRSRSKSNLTLAKEYPPRGNLICTSEDLLVGHSTNSRHMGIELRRGDVNPDKLTELQNHKEHLAAFMVHFIKYVAEHIMNNADVTFKDRFLKYRDMSQNHNHHKRFAEAIACLQIGWGTLLDFLQHIGHVDEAKHQELFDKGFLIFQNLAKRQNDLVQNDDAADKFMSALKELIDSKQIKPVPKDNPSTLHKEAIICYHDEDNYYFIPGAAYAAVATYFAQRGDHLNIGDYMLRKMLSDKKYIVESSDGDGHKTCKITVGVSRIRVMQIAKSVMDTF